MTRTYPSGTPLYPPPAPARMVQQFLRGRSKMR